MVKALSVAWYYFTIDNVEQGVFFSLFFYYLIPSFSMVKYIDFLYKFWKKKLRTLLLLNIIKYLYSDFRQLKFKSET